MTHELPTSYTHTCDPGHGWLLVTRSDLAAVGLTEADITPYSYQSGDWLALEEDCDAGTFFEAYKALRGEYPNNVSDEKGGRIRSWRSFGAKRHA
jgi:hypothetical protein